jgi:protein gp37
MANVTQIEWADSTFNPFIGCTKIGPGCDHCYAEQRMDTRLNVVHWGAGQPRKRTSAANWKLPIKWNAEPFYECPDCGMRGDAKTMGDDPKACKHLNAYHVRRRVFCASLADVFDNEVDPQWRADLFSLIQRTPALDWLLLTKRIGNVQALLPNQVVGGALPNNVWLGISVVNQAEADRDIPKLLATPAAVRFLSMEPLLGQVDLDRVYLNTEHAEWVDWVIVGGESGHKARPMHPDWVRSLRDQCASAGVPFLFKQWGEWAPNCTCDRRGAHACISRPVPGKPGVMFRCGKHHAGRTLDGITHTEYPKVKP